jgi:hypothetical protein
MMPKAVGSRDESTAGVGVILQMPPAGVEEVMAARGPDSWLRQARQERTRHGRSIQDRISVLGHG